MILLLVMFLLMPHSIQRMDGHAAAILLFDQLRALR